MRALCSYQPTETAAALKKESASIPTAWSKPILCHFRETSITRADKCTLVGGIRNRGVPSEHGG